MQMQIIYFFTYFRQTTKSKCKSAFANILSDVEVSPKQDQFVRVSKSNCNTRWDDDSCESNAFDHKKVNTEYIIKADCSWFWLIHRESGHFIF